MGTLALLHRLASFFLLAHETDRLWCRANELNVGRATNLGKVGIFAQQAVTRMDRVHIRDLRSGDHGRHIEVAIRRARRPNADGFIGKAHVQASCDPLRCRSRLCGSRALCRRR